MSDATRTLLASLSGAFLLGLAFLFFAGMTAALFMGWRGLKLARGHVTRLIGEVEVAMERTQHVAHDTAEAVIEPQLRVHSSLAGLRAGIRAFVHGRPEGARHDPPPQPPPF